MLRLITDFDGPIMDVSDRYYCVYQYCLQQTQLPAPNLKQLSQQEFWLLKRARVPEHKIGLLSGLDEEQAIKFAQKRRQTIHSLPYLVHDRVIPGVVATLEKVQQLGIDLVVMTMRRERELTAAFEKYDLARFFQSDRRYCLPNNYNKSTDTKDKLALMEKALTELPSASDIWMIGDTEADVIAATTHGVKVIGVLSGIRDRTQLEPYQPDYIVDNFSEAVKLVMKKVAPLEIG